MKRFNYILLSVLMFAVSCRTLELEPAVPSMADAPDGKVELTFKVNLPGKGPATKAEAGMDNIPHIDNIYVAVFGGSGYLNEWVSATSFVPAEKNYDPEDISVENNTTVNNTVYDVTFRLSMSSSRLRLHFIANCPEYYKTHAPISSVSEENTEEYIMTKVLRSQITDEHNDAYWQKIILPKGIKAEYDYVNNRYVSTGTDGDGNPIYTPSEETTDQFTDQLQDGVIVLVRNFARIYLVNETEDVDIIAYDLAFAPTEGPIAPILSSPYTADEYGNPITIQEDDDDTDFWPESFFINIQNHPFVAEEGKTSCTAAPYNYYGFSPSDLTLGTHPATHTGFAGQWVGARTDVQEPLFVYERIAPTSQLPATRILIYAKKGDEDAKYYALDILNSEKEAVPLIRNNTYTVVLTGIAAGTGETSAANAATTNSSNIAQSASQEIHEISDGRTSLGSSYTEKVFVSPVTTSDAEGAVYFRYLSNTEDKTLALDKVSIELGFKEDLVFTPLSSASSELKPALKNVQIAKTNGVPNQYVRKNNAWVTPGTGDDDLERWGKIEFSTVDNTDISGLVNSSNFYTQSLNETIRIIGESGLSRDVTIKIMPRQILKVKCMQPFVATEVGEKEVVRIYVPTTLTRSIFPLDFQIEAAAGSLTPDDDILPVENDTSIGFNTSTGVSFTTPSYHFIKSVTYSQYTTWVQDPNHKETISVSGNNTEFVFFDCKFKTNTKASATTVYVKNPFFEYGLGTSTYDSFQNYQQRLFSSPTLPIVAAGQKVSFTFKMDNEHNSKTGVNVKWHDQTPDSYSDNYRVIPKYINVVLDGCSPDSDYPNELSVNPDGDGYLFYVQDNNNQTAGDYISGHSTTTLHLVVDTDVEDGNYSVTLLTECLYDASSFPVHELYKPITKKAKAYEFSGGFATNKIAIGAGVEDTFRFNYDQACIEPITVTFTNCKPTGDTNLRSLGNGVYTFTPSDNQTSQSFRVSMTTPSDVPSITLNSDNYNQKTFTTNRYGRRVVSFNTYYRYYSNGYYYGDFTSTNNKTVTKEGVKIEFTSNRTSIPRDGQYITMYNNGNGVMTVTPPSGYSIKKVDVIFFSADYARGAVNVSSGDWSLSDSFGQWTGSSNSAVTFTMARYSNNYPNRITSVTVTVEEN